MNDNKIGPESFKPEGELILVLPDEAVGKTETGLIIPDSAQERAQTGTVIVIGDRVTRYAAGDRVLYGKTTGIRIDFKNDEAEQGFVQYVLMQQSQIFGKL